MRISKIFLIFLALIICAGTVAAHAPRPELQDSCYLLMVDRQQFGGWETIPVYGIPLPVDPTTHCYGVYPSGLVFLSVSKWVEKVGYQEVARMAVFPNSVLGKRVKLTELDSSALGLSGLVQLSIVGVTDKLFLFVDGVGQSPMVNYISSLGTVVSGGNMYFRGNIGGWFLTWFGGWLYQPSRDGTTKIIFVRAKFVIPGDVSILVNQPRWQGSAMADESWLVIQLPPGAMSFDPKQPVFLSISEEWRGGAPVNNIVWDPNRIQHYSDGVGFGVAGTN